MKKFFMLCWWIVLLIYFLLDTIAAGMGMGVPFFCIVLGFPVGWYVARRYLEKEGDLRSILKKILRDSLIASGITFLGMAVLWLAASVRFFHPGVDLRSFGIPMILYDPLASFVAWLALMIVISPLLQLLAATFASYITLMAKTEKPGIKQE
jgi:hypothetical protein